MELLRENQDLIDWELLSGNPNPTAIALLTANQDEIYWDQLSRNPSDGAVALLRENRHLIYWRELSQNTNPNALEMVRAVPRYIAEIDWREVLSMPHIFKYDYPAMFSAMYSESGIAEQLMANRFNPSNMGQFANWGFEEIAPDEYDPSQQPGYVARDWNNL